MATSTFRIWRTSPATCFYTDVQPLKTSCEAAARVCVFTRSEIFAQFAADPSGREGEALASATIKGLKHNQHRQEAVVMSGALTGSRKNVPRLTDRGATGSSGSVAGIGMNLKWEAP